MLNSIDYIWDTVQRQMDRLIVYTIEKLMGLIRLLPTHQNYYLTFLKQKELRTPFLPVELPLKVQL